MKYDLNMPDGQKKQITFDGVIYKGDILKFEGADTQYEVNKRFLSVPFDLDEPITDVVLEVEIYS
ncbi:hypothetical protein [Pseudomonas paraveronii]|uniref:hypothetical protein n=1 Tax=Pseudomonas paraveronii TaxID=3040598 RepID=UPI002AB1FA4B|nr:hypothetical protein [Pseudomonas sp. V3/K/3/5]